MPKPTTVLEIAFDAGYTGTPTWTDVTTYLQHPAGGIGLDKWRSEELAVCPPSRCSFVLDNRDGRFTPGRAAGAHYPNVKKGRRIRVRSTVDAVTTTRFLGYIDDWAVEWPGHVSTFATCLVTASSRTARLGKTTELRSIVEEEYLADNPFAMYILDEPAGSVAAYDSSGNQAPPLVSAQPLFTPVTFAGGVGPTTDDKPCVLINAGDWLVSGPQGDMPGGATTYWFECFFATSVSVTDLWVMSLTQRGTGTVVGYLQTRTPTGILRASVGALTIDSAVSVTDGAIHHALVEYTTGGGFNFYLDGTLVGSDATNIGAIPTVDRVHVGGNSSSPTSSFAGSIAYAAFGYGDLIADRVAAHSGAGRTGFEGETAAERLTRYAGFAGIPSSECSFDTGQVPDLAHIDTEGETALDVMRVVEETEGGVLFDAGDGTLTFQDRSHRYGAASSFTVPASVVVTPITPVLDDQLMVNDMTATGSTDITAHVFDSTSIDDYGPYRESLELATSDAEEPFQAASWRVGRYAEPVVRLSTVEILLNKCDAALTAAIMAAEPGTKFTLTGLSSTNAPATSMDLFVEGMQERIDASEHRVIFRTSPAELFGVWILGTSALGVDTMLGY